MKEVPDQPPIKLPARPDSFTLGTKLADLIQLDDGALAREERIRLNAMLILALGINSWRCNKPAGLLTRSEWVHLKLICALAMEMTTENFYNGAREQ